MIARLNEQKSSDEQNWLTSFLGVAIALLILRLISLYFNNSDLFFDEAQYWAWSQEPAFGYFSKPPLLAWLIGTTTTLCGDSEFCVRLGSPVLHSLTAMMIFLISTRLFDQRTGFWAGVIYLTLPAVSLSSTLISTDVPLLFMWSLAFYALIRIEETPTIKWVFVLGLAIGAGLLAKYAMAYFLLCAVFYSIISKQRPHLLAIPSFWLSVLIALIILTPNIWWNFEHQFATLDHTGENIGWGSGLFHFDKMAEFIGSQFGVMGPILFGIYLVAVFRLIREGMNEQQLLLLSFSLPVLILITVQALLSKAFANWAVTAYPAAIILLADLLVNHMPKIWGKISLGLHTLVFALVAVVACFAGPGQLPIENEINPFKRMWGGNEQGNAITEVLDAGEYTNVLTDNRRTSSTLIYYLRDRPESVVAWRSNSKPRDHFEFSRAIQDMDITILSKAKFLYVTSRPEITKSIADHFNNKTLIQQIDNLPGKFKTLYLYELEGYSS